MGTIYLSGPITGKTYQDARFGWRSSFAKKMLQKMRNAGSYQDHVLLSPMRHEGHLAEVKGPLDKEYPDNLFSHPKMIVAKDFLDINTSDIVLVYLLDATKVSIGTMVELGYAKARGKTIVTVMQKGNLHEHPFVTEVSDAVVETLEDAVAICDSLLSEGI